MSTAESLLAEARGLGLRIVAEGDRLRFHPQGRMTPGLADRLREHRAEVVAHLAAAALDGREQAAVHPAAEALDGQADLDTAARPDWANPELWQEQPDGALVRVDCEPAARLEDCEEPGPPCPTCNSLEYWTDGLGRRRCQACDAEALGRARKLAAAAAGLRRRYGQRPVGGLTGR